MKTTPKLPAIGLRIIKSAIAVFLCYGINLLRNGQGILFYSQIAAVWCIHDYISGTFKMAKQRFNGTVIGAAYGLVALFLFKCLGLRDDSLDTVAIIVRALCVSLFIVLTIYTTVLLNQKKSSFFTCVVFLSIVVNHIGDVNPYIFVWNRFLDTTIGIVIGVLVNCFSLPRDKHREILFVSSIDDTLLDSSNKLSSFERVELNRMIEDGAMFTVSTLQTPAKIRESLGDIRLLLPAIVMNGAALYDFGEKRYLKVFSINEADSEQIIRFLNVRSQPYFANVVLQDLLVIYYQDTDSEIYNRLIRDLRKSPFRNYLNLPMNSASNVVYFMMIDHTVIIDKLYLDMCAAVENGALPDTLNILKYASPEYPGYSYIKVFHRDATRKNMLQELQQFVPCEKVVTFGTIEGLYDHVVDPGDPNLVVRLMKKDYEPLKRIGRK